MPNIAIIGTTTWGITLGMVLARNGLQVRLWARTEQEATQLTNAGPNPAVAPGVEFPAKLAVTTS
jgi:glycerol-3-phosphate dehydrogenase (NAD(P)+)